MVDHGHCLFSTKEAYSKECDKLRAMFSKLCYPKTKVNSTIHGFSQQSDREPHAIPPDPPVYLFLPFNNQQSTNRVCREIHSLGSMIDVDVKPVFISRKLSPILSVKENKPVIVNTQWKYLFECNLYDANYVGYTT